MMNIPTGAATNIPDQKIRGINKETRANKANIENSGLIRLLRNFFPHSRLKRSVASDLVAQPRQLSWILSRNSGLSWKKWIV